MAVFEFVNEGVCAACRVLNVPTAAGGRGQRSLTFKYDHPTDVFFTEPAICCLHINNLILMKF